MKDARISAVPANSHIFWQMVIGRYNGSVSGFRESQYWIQKKFLINFIEWKT